MPAIEAIGVILGIVVAVLTIMNMTGGKKVPNGVPREDIKVVSGPTPVLSRAAFEQQAASMPVEWVTYEGATPPLKLKIRGATEAMYRNIARLHPFDATTPEQQRAALRSINAELYVLDWDGAHYANGNKIPFSVPSLELMLAKDPELDAFLSGEIRRINPDTDI